MAFPKGKKFKPCEVRVCCGSIKETAGERALGRDSIGRLIDNGELDAIEFPKMGGKGLNRKRMVDDEEIKRFKERRAIKRKRDRTIQ